MGDIHVLVVFYSRTGQTERLALAAAVGAVQAKANIRLRWLREVAEDFTIRSVPEWKENRERMEKEYVAPREADAVWADALVIGTNGAPSELKDYLASLEALRTSGKLDGKIATAFSSGSSADCAPLFAALAQLGCVVVPSGFQPDAIENARLQGRRVAEVARALQGLVERHG